MSRFNAINCRDISLLGQGGVPQLACAEPALAPPGHLDGSTWTLFIKQGLDQRCVPPPQVALHPPVGCHGPQTPLDTANKYMH